MSMKSIRNLWDGIEPGWKILGTAGVVVASLFTSISYAVDLHAKAERVPEMERAINRIDRNISRIAEKFNINIEDPRN